MASTFLILSATALAYYLTTFVLWFSHWFSHLDWSPLRTFHLLGHHTIYPNGKNCLTPHFIYGKGWHDSMYTFIPWLTLEALGIWLALPTGLAIWVSVLAAAIVWAFSHLHEQFHISNCRYRRSGIFNTAKSRHFRHHDEDVNYSVFDPFWDKVFGTFRESAEETKKTFKI